MDEDVEDAGKTVEFVARRLNVDMAAATDDVVVLAAAAVAVETEGEAQVSVDVSVAVPSWCLMVVVQSFLACDRHDGARGKCGVALIAR